jgi:hypothetical protein
MLFLKRKQKGCSPTGYKFKIWETEHEEQAKNKKKAKWKRKPRFQKEN